MARIARIVVPKYPHHIVQRGNRRQDVFFSREDYMYYMELLKKSCEEYGGKEHGSSNVAEYDRQLEEVFATGRRKRYNRGALQADQREGSHL